MAYMATNKRSQLTEHKAPTVNLNSCAEASRRPSVITGSQRVGGPIGCQPQPCNPPLYSLGWAERGGKKLPVDGAC